MNAEPTDIPSTTDCSQAADFLRQEGQEDTVKYEVNKENSLIKFDKPTCKS
jgi:hypothetical protein